MFTRQLMSYKARELNDKLRPQNDCLWNDNNNNNINITKR